MKYPKVNIVTDTMGEFSSNFICFLAKGVSMGEYQNNGFCVLPYLSKNNPKSIIFPDLNYSRSFWKYIQNDTNKNLNDNFPRKAVCEINALIKQSARQANTLEELKKEWYAIERQFFDDVDKFLEFKKELAKISEINILLTPYGTRGSFNPPRIGNKFKLFVTSRIDVPAGNIGVLILQNLFIMKTRLGGEINSNEYIRRMSAITFLYKHTYFSKYYPKYADLLNENYDYNQKEMRDSYDFLKKLGFENKEAQINLADTNLTKQELIVLQLMIKNKGKIISFDEIASSIWGSQVDDKFSLSAIAKLIQNLRIKIRNQGIKKEVIFTKRGSGYLLI